MKQSAIKKPDAVIPVQKDLYKHISTLIESSRTKIAATINTELVLLYWNIGKILLRIIFLTMNELITGKKFLINYLNNLQNHMVPDGQNNNLDIFSAVQRLFQKMQFSPQCGEN